MNHLARVSMVDCKGTSLSALSVLTGLKHFSYERNEIEDMNDEADASRYAHIIPGTVSVDFLCNEVWRDNPLLTNYHLIRSLESISLTNSEVESESLKLLLIGKGLIRLQCISILKNKEITCFRDTCCNETGAIVCNPKLTSVTLSPGFEKTDESLWLMETFLHANQNIGLFKVVSYDVENESTYHSDLINVLEDQCAMNPCRALEVTGVDMYGRPVQNELKKKEHLMLYDRPMEGNTDNHIRLNPNIWPLVLGKASTAKYPLCNNNDLPDTELEELRQAEVTNDVLYHLIRHGAVADLFSNEMNG